MTPTDSVVDTCITHYLKGVIPIFKLYESIHLQSLYEIIQSQTKKVNRLIVPNQ